MNRSPYRIRGWLGMAVLLWTLGVGSGALAQTAWESNRENCEPILSNPQHFDLSELRTCAQRWEAYGDPAALSAQQAQAFARGFSRLVYQGNDSDQRMAQTALSRLGLTALPRDDVVPDERLERFLSRSRSPIPVGPSTERARNRARDDNSAGMREYARGNYEAAAGHFEEALEEDPWFHLAKYNLVCQDALLGRTDEAIRHLDELSRWTSPEAEEQTTHALTDSDLDSLRDDPRFRIIMGQAHVQLLNGAGRDGLDAVQAIHDGLTAAGMTITSYGYDRYTRARPLVYYRRGFEETAETAAAVIDREDTRIEPLTWSSEHDLVVVFGAPRIAALRRPVVQGLLRVDGGDPEEAIEEVEDAADLTEDMVEDPAGTTQEVIEEWMP